MVLVDGADEEQIRVLFGRYRGLAMGPSPHMDRGGQEERPRLRPPTPSSIGCSSSRHGPRSGSRN